MEEDVAEVEGLKFSYPFNIITTQSDEPTILYSRSDLTEKETCGCKLLGEL